MASIASRGLIELLTQEECAREKSGALSLKESPLENSPHRRAYYSVLSIP